MRRGSWHFSTRHSPPPPTTTSLYSLKNCACEYRNVVSTRTYGWDERTYPWHLCSMKQERFRTCLTVQTRKNEVSRDDQMEWGDPRLNYKTLIGHSQINDTNYHFRLFKKTKLFKFVAHLYPHGRPSCASKSCTKAGIATYSLRANVVPIYREIRSLTTCFDRQIVETSVLWNCTPSASARRTSENPIIRVQCPAVSFLGRILQQLRASSRTLSPLNDPSSVSIRSAYELLTA